MSVSHRTLPRFSGSSAYLLYTQTRAPRVLFNSLFFTESGNKVEDVRYVSGITSTVQIRSSTYSRRFSNIQTTELQKLPLSRYVDVYMFTINNQSSVPRIQETCANTTISAFN